MSESALRILLEAMPSPAIAISGGVDSMTLAAFANGLRPDVLMVHAVSPAVPRQATERVQRNAAERGWNLIVVNAGEFDDPRYRANPVNRCFYCKTNLYGVIVEKTNRQVLSGANVDDLGEYRPGLDAAREYGVRHPYIEASMHKSAVRALARSLGLTEVAELPSSPCLSSRVETGIRIEASTLSFIHDVELMLTEQLLPKTVRCRVRADSVVIELDANTLQQLNQQTIDGLCASISSQRDLPEGKQVRFETYRNGSAFLIQRATL
jgi:uncharacterized protein